MKALIVGMGSMGRRRARLLTRFFGAEVRGVDAREERREQALCELGVKCYESIDAALAEFSPDCALVCTSPLSHADIITELLEKNLNVFTEINLVSDGYERNAALAREKELVLFLSSTQLYRRELAWVRGRVAEARRPLRYRYRVGQYLPDWHPWESFKDFFVGDKRTNGCREIMAIELPWLERAFGKITSAAASAATLTDLKLGCPDSYFITLAHEGVAEGQLFIDVVSRKAARSLEIVGEDIYTAWNGSPDGLLDYDIRNKADVKIDLYESIERDGRYAENIVENAYVDELAAFIEALGGGKPACHTFEDDARLLGVIDEIEGV